MRGIKSEITRLIAEMSDQTKRRCCGSKERLKRRIFSVYRAIQVERGSAKREFSFEELDMFEEKVKELAKILNVSLEGIK